jgi:DNA-binding response OmpR family regulator
MSDPHRILFVEDDPEIGSLVRDALREVDYAVVWVQDGQEGLDHFLEDDFDLVLLDLRLPGLGGLEVCRQVREVDRFIPIVMLTAKAEKRDVVRGLELGADDYITKPFSVEELLARLRALFRRITADQARRDASDDASIQVGDLHIYPEKHKVVRAGERIDLTAKEFDLLLVFAEHPGRAFSRGELLERVWGSQFDGYDHTVNTHINRLRNKVEPEPARPRYICTVWGVGYRFAEPEELDA